VVLDLYARRFQGRRLEPGEFVVPADEKTSVQARCRCHPTLPPGRARMMKVEYEYERGGALAYLAAWDVHQARLFRPLRAVDRHPAFGRLVEQVMACEPYASARRVFWIVDNGSSHRGQASVDRLQGAWPNLRLVHLPVHASWLNQVQVYFSVVQRKVLTPTTSPTLASSSGGCWASSAATSRPRCGRVALHHRRPGRPAPPTGRGTAAHPSGMTLTQELPRRSTKLII
jgi:hypothetical protein